MTEPPGSLRRPDKPASIPPDPAYVRAMLERFADVVAQVMFGNYEVRALSDRDDAFADFAMYLNTLIAALQRRENEVSAYQQRLESMVEQRTQQLREAKTEVEQKARQIQTATAQLIQTEKPRALGEMSAGVAHEMNQPLNAIRLVCQDVLRDTERDRLEVEALGPNLEEIISMVDKMAAIVDEMRLFSRRPSEVPREYRADVNEAIDGVFRLLGQQLYDRGIEVVQRLDRELPPAHVDPVKLEQVLMNLITNARDAVEERGDSAMRIEVAADEHGDASASAAKAVVVEVSDNGPGLSTHARNRIFEPFYTTKKQGEGTGLGLSISKQLIAEAGGQIELGSEQGRGTTFRVVLRAVD